MTGREHSSDSTWLFGLFAAALALSLVLHQVWWFGFEVLSVHFVVVLAALWTLLRPTSVVRFLTMLAAEVCSVALDLPDVGSHTLLVFVSGACVLAYVGWTSLGSRRLPDPGGLFERIAPFLRVQLILVYAVAAIAKLNTGFFDGEVSCGAALSAQVAWFDPSLLDGAWRVLPSIYGTVAIEVALPVLLTIRRTRLLGLALGVGFHAVLALAGNVPFSALALALYVAFLPADMSSRVRAVASERSGLGLWARRARRLAASRAALPVAVGSWLVAAAVLTPEPALARALIANGTRLLVVAIIFIAVGVFVLGLRKGGVPASAGSLRLGHPVFAVGIAVLIVNSLSPYIGLKTDTSFTMFSNLQTEAGRWNHVLIPEAVRVFGYQDELVRVTDSNDPTLVRRTAQGTVVVRYELERYVRSRPGTSAAYAQTASGAPGLGVARSQDRATVVTPVIDRLVKFRDVRAPERSGC